MDNWTINKKKLIKRLKEETIEPKKIEISIFRNVLNEKDPQNLVCDNLAIDSALTHPIDSLLQQLHSEYRSTYTWHEYTGPHQEQVVRRAPQPPPTSSKSTLFII